MSPSRLHGFALALLLGASVNEVQATRVRTVARASGRAHRLRIGRYGESIHTTPWTPTRAASAVMDFFEMRGPNSTNSAFQAECVDLVTAKVDHLDEAWSDVHVKAVLNTECVEKKLFLAASSNRSAEHQDCLAFAGRLAGARRARIANGTAAGYTDFCKEYAALAQRSAEEYAPSAEERGRPNDKVHDHTDNPAYGSEAEEEVSSVGSSAVLIQGIFGIVYYFMVVSKYPMVPEIDNIPDDHPARQLQDKNEVTSIGQVGMSNCFLSFCCPAARAAHTFHATETLNYWASFCIMFCCPVWGICGMLFLGNSCTPMNKKLGGTERNPVMGILCAWCCQCCVIAQDAESMDLLVGAKTGLCSVTKADN